MLTWVLLNVARMLAMPELMFLACLALMIFLAAASSPKSSAAVGAAGMTAASAGLAVSAAGALAAGDAPAGASGPGAAFFRGFSSTGLTAASAASGLASFFLGAGFFFSSDIQ